MSTTLQPSCDIVRSSLLMLRSEVLSDVCDSRLEVDPRVRFDFGKSDYKAFVLCKYIKNNFTFACAMDGEFKFHEPLSKENAILAWVNASTILYGLIRNLYSIVSAQSIHQELMLPTVMMRDIIRDKIEKSSEKSNDAKNE